MEEYHIDSVESFDRFTREFYRYFGSLKEIGKPFTPIKIIAKKAVKSKSHAQHRYYWALINEMKTALKDNGILLNQEEIHELVKREAKFTKMVEINNKHYMVVCSIADTSDDIDSESMTMLCDFVKQFCAENLGVDIGT